MDYEVAIPTRGGDISAVLAGLISQACHEPFLLRILPERPLWQSCDPIIEVLRRLGCQVQIEYQWHTGLGPVRAQAIMDSVREIMIQLDDDAVLYPSDALPRLAHAAKPWSVPIIRFVQNFAESPLPEHTEIWEQVSTTDPRVIRSLRAYGPGWVRVYETGEDQETDQLGGTCWAIRTSSIPEKVWISLLNWDNHCGTDLFIGQQIKGTGTVVSGVYAYHFGAWTPDKWGQAELAHTVMVTDMDLYQRMIGVT